MRIGYEKLTTASHLTKEPKSYVSEVHEHISVADHLVVREQKHRLTAGKSAIKLEIIDQHFRCVVDFFLP